MGITIIDKLQNDLQIHFLCESESDNIPVIRQEGGNIYFPALVRCVQKEIDGKYQNFYRFFEVSVPYTGQDLTNYEKCKLQSYAALRKYFYGDWAVQNEQILKGTFSKHQYAVKQAFPKYEGETLPEVERFNQIFEEFWKNIDEACAAVGKSRADLPEKFNAEEMLFWANENGMSQENIAYFAQVFSVVSMNLLQNGRNWDELF